MIAKLLTRLFRLEEINGNHRCPTYLYRWELFRRGGYTETTLGGVRDFDAPWFRRFPATHVHRVALNGRPECWTLVVVSAASRPWGFWHDGVWMHWREYVRGRFSHLADQRAVCRGME